MRIISVDDFKKLAQNVVDAYIQQSVPLANSLSKIALDNTLNPEQIKNLVQLANTMTHLALFDQKNDGDKIIEFDPADPSSIIKKIFTDENCEDEMANSSESPDSESSGSDMFENLSDTFSKIKNTLQNSHDVAPKDEHNDSAASSSDAFSSNGAFGSNDTSSSNGLSPVKKQMLIIKIRKVASELENKKLQAAYEYKSELDKLASDFAKLYGPSISEFEKDAYALRGNLALPIIADLRHCLKMPSFEDKHIVKTARVVDSGTREMHSLDKLIKLNDEFNNYAETFEYLKKHLGN